MKNILILLILISLSIQSKPEDAEDCKELSFLSHEENVKIIGRFYQNNNITWIVHSGSALEFYIIGNFTEVILVGD